MRRTRAGPRPVRGSTPRPGTRADTVLGRRSRPPAPWGRARAPGARRGASMSTARSGGYSPSLRQRLAGTHPRDAPGAGPGHPCGARRGVTRARCARAPGNTARSRPRPESRPGAAPWRPWRSSVTPRPRCRPPRTVPGGCRGSPRRPRSSCWRLSGAGTGGTATSSTSSRPATTRPGATSTSRRWCRCSPRPGTTWSEGTCGSSGCCRPPRRRPSRRWPRPPRAASAAPRATPP